MEPNILDRLLDRIQKQERRVVRGEKKLSKAQEHIRGLYAKLDKAVGPASHDIVPTGEGGPSKVDVVENLRGVICEKDVVIADLKGDVGRLKTQAARRTELHQEQVSRYEDELAKLRGERGAARGADGEDKLVEMVESQAERVGELEQKLTERNEELAAVREQRDRLIADNTALANARDACRRDKHAVEDELAECQRVLSETHRGEDGVRVKLDAAQDELRQVRHTLDMEQAHIEELRDEGRQYRDYGFQVRQHSPNIHKMASEAVLLPEDWHQSGSATQGEDFDG